MLSTEKEFSKLVNPFRLVGHAFLIATALLDFNAGQKYDKISIKYLKGLRIIVLQPSFIMQLPIAKYFRVLPNIFYASKINFPKNFVIITIKNKERGKLTSIPLWAL